MGGRGGRGGKAKERKGKVAFLASRCFFFKRSTIDAVLQLYWSVCACSLTLRRSTTVATRANTASLFRCGLSLPSSFSSFFIRYFDCWRRWHQHLQTTFSSPPLRRSTSSRHATKTTLFRSTDPPLPCRPPRPAPPHRRKASIASAHVVHSPRRQSREGYGQEDQGLLLLRERQ